jgi:hypothetical protein
MGYQRIIDPRTGIERNQWDQADIDRFISAALARGVSMAKINEFRANNPGDENRIADLQPDSGPGAALSSADWNQVLATVRPPVATSAAASSAGDGMITASVMAATAPINIGPSTPLGRATNFYGGGAMPAVSPVVGPSGFATAGLFGLDSTTLVLLLAVGVAAFLLLKDKRR